MARTIAGMQLEQKIIDAFGLTGQPVVSLSLHFEPDDVPILKVSLLIQNPTDWVEELRKFRLEPVIPPVVDELNDSPLI